MQWRHPVIGMATVSGHVRLRWYGRIPGMNAPIARMTAPALPHHEVSPSEADSPSDQRAARRDRSLRLQGIYKDKVRSIVKSVTAERLTSIDAVFEDLKRAEQHLDQAVRVGLLGTSTAGKSTLLNAIAFGGQSVLPTGGVGALTAQATRIVRSAEHYFEVAYRARSEVRHMVFGLEHILHPVKRRQLAGMEDAVKDLAAALDQDDDHCVATRLKRRAAMLIRGDQNANLDPEYMLGMLRRIEHPDKDGHPEPLPEDTERVTRLEATVQADKAPVRVAGSWTDKAFRARLRDHAAGFLAPLVDQLEVGGPWDLCDERTILVDLPGVGISGDSHVGATEAFVRDEADVLMLVVTKAGIDAATRDILANAGLLGRLQHAADRLSSDPLGILVVATKMDLSAMDRFRELVQDGDQIDGPAVIGELAGHMRVTLRNQLASELGRIAEMHTGAAGKAVTEVVKDIVGRATYHAVSTTEYADLLASQAIPPSPIRPKIITEVGQSGIPDLKQSLTQAVASIQELRWRRFGQALAAADDAIAGWSRFVAGRYIGAGIRQRSQEFTKALRDELAGLLKEVYARLGSFRGFLRDGVPERIGSLVAVACGAAQEDLRRELRVYRDTHWASLRAAVRKNGQHHGVNVIELPRLFADHFEAQVVPLWQSKVLAEVRKEVGQLAKHMRAVVDAMAAWAEQQRLAGSDEVLHQLAKDIGDDIKRLEGGVDLSAEAMRETVRVALYRQIRKPIADACTVFVARNDDKGRGVKARIIDLFDDLVVPSLAEAGQHSAVLMNQAFQAVSQRLVEGLDAYADVEGRIKAVLEPSLDHKHEQERKRCERAVQQVREFLMQAGLTSVQEAVA